MKRHGAACGEVRAVGVAVTFGGQQRDQGANEQRDYASEQLICTLT